MGGSKALENAYDMIRYVDKNKIEGGIIECGVAEGGTSAMMALTNRIGNFQTRNLYLFDSFEGLPSPTSEDFYNGTTGDFRIVSDSTGYIKIMYALENMGVFIPNGAVELYHNNSKKFETTSSGVKIIGNLELDSVAIAAVQTSSEAFADMFIQHVLPAFFNNDSDLILEKSKITQNGELTSKFDYLQDFVID